MGGHKAVVGRLVEVVLLARDADAVALLVRDGRVLERAGSGSAERLIGHASRRAEQAASRGGGSEGKGEKESGEELHGGGVVKLLSCQLLSRR